MSPIHEFFRDLKDECIQPEPIPEQMHQINPESTVIINAGLQEANPTPGNLMMINTCGPLQQYSHQQFGHR